MMVLFSSVIFALLVHCSGSKFDQSSQKIPSNARYYELPLVGDVPRNAWFFHAIVDVGPVHYHLHLDTGSSSTWIQCVGPHAKRTYNPPYVPHNNRVAKRDPDCPSYSARAPPKDLCDFDTRYMDGGSCTGIMVRDAVQLWDRGSHRKLYPQIIFGCGIYRRPPHLGQSFPYDGILGLGRDKTSFTSQLVSHNLTNNFFGHCLRSVSTRPGGNSGYVFFGHGNSQSSNDVVWLPLQKSQDHYIIGPATFSIDGVPHRARVQSIVVDSGSSYTFFTTTIYRDIKRMIEFNLNQSRAPFHLIRGTGHTSVCWEIRGPFHGIDQLIRKGYFKTIKLNFTGNRILLLRPQDYLFPSPHPGNICLGILENPFEATNIIGAVSMFDKVVMYDNERGRFGWSNRRTICKYPTSTATSDPESVSTNVSSYAVHGATH